MVTFEHTETCAGGANVIAFPLRNWRHRVGNLIDQATKVIGQVNFDLLYEVEMNREATYARVVLNEALDLCDRDVDVLLFGKPDDFFGWVVLPATALCVSAQAMSNVHPQLALALQPAVAALEEAAGILDEAGSLDLDDPVYL